jgi:hypothetical protein
MRRNTHRKAEWHDFTEAYYKPGRTFVTLLILAAAIGTLLLLISFVATLPDQAMAKIQMDALD